MKFYYKIDKFSQKPRSITTDIEQLNKKRLRYGICKLWYRYKILRTEHLEDTNRIPKVERFIELQEEKSIPKPTSYQ